MTVKEFLTIEDPEEIEIIKTIKKGIKSRNNIKGYKSLKFTDYSYGVVEQLKEWYMQGNVIYIASKTTKIGHRELLKSDYKDFLYFLKYVDEQMEIITGLESKLNKSDDPEEQMKLEAAGVEELKIFGVLNVVDSLAGGDMLKWNSISRLPWKNVYTKLLKNKTDTSIQKRYAKLNSKK